jgi:serine/threonine protein kinase
MLIHENVIKLIEVLGTNSKFYFVFEYIQGGDLSNKIGFNKIKKNKKSYKNMKCNSYLLS